METETGTVFPAEQEAGGHGQSQFFPSHIPDVDMRGPLQEGIEIGILRRFRIGAEDGRIDIDVQIGAKLGQATPALGLQHAPE